MTPFLVHTDVVDFDHPAVAAKGRQLSRPNDTIATARACFEFVRDEIRHSFDYRASPATCRASDVLLHRTGYCYAKAHLLASLCRANGIPTGFCYQRLSFDGVGPPFTLHGLCAVHLPGHGWYRIDPRGNKPGVDARFTPPVERLAFRPALPGEADFSPVLPDPLPCVVDALTASATWEDVLRNLPDIAPEQFPAGADARVT